MLERVIPRDAAILEVGCGVGRNLAYLYDRGYTNLGGIEADPQAVALLRKTYPQLKDITIHEGTADDVLAKLTDDEYNVAFSVSALQHIDPDRVEVFDDLVRVARQMFVIEGPARKTRGGHRHDYDAVFTSRGMTSLGTRSVTDIRVGPEFGQYVGRRYRRMDRQASLHRFWRQPTPPGNNPHDYAKATRRSHALLEIISDLPKDALRSLIAGTAHF